MKPRLLILLNRLSIGGPASNTLPLAAALKNNFDILLVAGNPLPDEQSAKHLLDKHRGLRTIILPEIRRAIHPAQDLETYRKLLQIIRDFQPQIVHTHGSKPGFLGRIAAAKCKVPLVVHTYHGHVFKSYFSPLVSSLIIHAERTLARKTNFLIAINEHLQKELIDEYKIATASKIKLNRLGIDINGFKDSDHLLRKKFRNEFKLNDDVFAIAIVGRLVKIKQHQLFLDIASELLLQKRNIKRYCFFIVGDGEEYEPILSQSLSMGYRVLRKNQPANGEYDIVFTSWRKDIDVVMSGIDLLLMTSLNEGTPVAILEAMAAGKPIVSTPVGGIPELIASANCGFVSSKNAEIVKQISMLADAGEERITRGLKGRQYVEENLTIERQAKELSELYSDGLKASQTAVFQ